tara:strand:+ start:660576 stop:661964 length:1389 start_codon:yes stop_codon:yes gene_type:complete
LKYKLLLISFLIFSSCVSDKTVAEASYFGGKIINPKSNKVLFYQSENLLDSTELDHNNKFLFKFDSLKVGLYTFKHDREVQYVFLEPTDSLLLRLNTWDFDESLVFSGRGSERNNLLINLFLENEKEDKLVYNFYELNDRLFDLKIDSLLKQKKLLYALFKENTVELNPLFDKYINAAIQYPLYKKKEVYPFRHKKALRLDNFPHMDPAFYKYRKDINLNDQDLYNFYAYYEYVRDYLYHLSYEKYIINNTAVPINFLEVTVKHIQIKNLKNRLLDEAMWNILLDDNIASEDKEAAKELFFENCDDEKLISSISSLIKASESPKKGAVFPEVIALNTADEKIRLNEVMKDKNSVLYFWPRATFQVESLAKRVHYLEKQHPDITFIGINSKHIDYNWKAYIKSNNFNSNNQFCLVNGSTNTDEWLYNDFARAILVDKNGVVLNGFTYLSNAKFEQQLKKFKNH